MYNIKEVIERMKKVANISSNASLARLLNISYNTLNTWIKRNKLPQEVLIEFAKKFNTSLDYLIFGHIEPDEIEKIEDQKITNEIEFIYYGEYEPLNITINSKLKLNSTLLHSGAYYLLKQNDIYYIAKAYFNPFEENVLIKTSFFEKTIKKDIFLQYKIGLIQEITKL